MFRIREKQELAPGIIRMSVEAPRVAASALPGQFVIVRADEHGERVPLTVADYDAAAGTVTIVTQMIGVSTRKICALEVGDALSDFAGPLGRPSDFVSCPLEELKAIPLNQESRRILLDIALLYLGYHLKLDFNTRAIRVIREVFS